MWWNMWKCRRHAVLIVWMLPSKGREQKASLKSGRFFRSQSSTGRPQALHGLLDNSSSDPLLLAPSTCSFRTHVRLMLYDLLIWTFSFVTLTARPAAASAAVLFHQN